ncbi:MAG TPA: hypothetical protein VHX88_16785 [Solirubrobacteraceae bacterium]|jgi:hypothetical protein|nr:hypothetical protein [Solirubrobacteraceae bacterium]
MTRAALCAVTAGPPPFSISYSGSGDWATDHRGGSEYDTQSWNLRWTASLIVGAPTPTTAVGASAVTVSIDDRRRRCTRGEDLPSRTRQRVRPGVRYRPGSGAITIDPARAGPDPPFVPRPPHAG